MSMPVAAFGLEVPPGVMVPVNADKFPASIVITMAAIDPTEEPEADDDGNVPAVPRSTLYLVKQQLGQSDDEDSEIDEEDLEALLNGAASEDDEDEDEEANGGPSDPAKSKKAKKAASLESLLKAAAKDGADSDEEMEDGDEEEASGSAASSSKKVNGTGKGKEIATADDEEEEEDEDEDSDDDDIDLERFVLCTLDTERVYQQPLSLTVSEGEKAFFVVNGTHSVHLTGNYVIDDSDLSDEDEDEDEQKDYLKALRDTIDDYVSDESSDGVSSGEESDELDDIADPRVTEIDEEDEVPKLVKGKNKRPADDEAEGLDDIMTKEAKVDQTKLSKKQQKKLKNNKGDAVQVGDSIEAKETVVKEQAKKVQFAKNLEQGPTPSSKPAATKDAKTSPSLGVKTVQGVTIDDRKIGTGRVVKTGDRVSCRYIGKLKDGKVFDSNKKGSPFSFRVGKGEVIQGWDIGIQGMTIGGERRITIPANLGYGKKAQPGIPPNSQLQFDIKLLEIK